MLIHHEDIEGELLEFNIKEFSISEKLIIRNLCINFINDDIIKNCRYSLEYVNLLKNIYDYLFHYEHGQAYLISPHSKLHKLPYNIFICISEWRNLNIDEVIK